VVPAYISLSLLSLNSGMPAAAAVSLLLASAAVVGVRGLRLVPTSNATTIWASIDALHKCGVNDVPDIPARLFADGTGLLHMIEGSTAFHWHTGNTIYNLTRNCTAAWNSTQDPDPSMFAAAEWLDSPHVFPNGTVVALVHTEFDGHRLLVPPCNGSYPYCWMATVGLAISNDWGYTWQHARPPPAHLVATVPYEFNGTQRASGWGDPSNIVQSPKDGLFYAGFLNRNTVGLQAGGVCFARTSDLTDPTSWRAWGGAEWNVTLFVSPYAAVAPADAAQHVCAVSFIPGMSPGASSSSMPSGLAWSTYLEQFVITLDDMDNQHDLFVATSDDLVTWSTPQPFYSFSDLPANVKENVTSLTYPTLVDLDHGGPNFMAIGQNATLLWVSIGHSPYTDGRRVWATNVTFLK
jgi:hypothetical protein